MFECDRTRTNILFMVSTYLIETSAIPIAMASHVLVSVAKVVTSVWAPISVQTLSYCKYMYQRREV